MNQPTTSDVASAATVEDQEIRERVKGLTSLVLQQGRVDPEAIKEIVRAVMGVKPGAPLPAVDARDMFAEALRTLDEALVKSASETHQALQQLVSRGENFTDNDLKEALVSLRRLEQDSTAAANRIGEAMTTNLRREMAELAVRAQNVGVEASARVADLLSQLAGVIGTTPATIRGASARVTLVLSGVLAGVADALSDQSKTKSM